MRVTRKVNKEEFYPTYIDWCKQHTFPEIPITAIESIFVLYGGVKPIYACQLWTTKSDMCMIGFPVSNPNISYEEREGGLNKLFEDMSDYIRERGYKVIWTTSATERVIKGLTNSGFNLSEDEVGVYIKTLF